MRNFNTFIAALLQSHHHKLIEDLIKRVERKKKEKNIVEMTWIARLMAAHLMNMIIMKLESTMMMMVNWCGKGEETKLCKKKFLITLVYTIFYNNYCFTNKFLSHLWNALGHLLTFNRFRRSFFETNTYKITIPKKLLRFNKYRVNKSSNMIEIPAVEFI